VVLKVLVGADGAVENVHTVSGNAQLASAAEYAVRQWRFRPLVANGHPAEFETHVTVNFAHP
jgi:TonB family protein